MLTDFPSETVRGMASSAVRTLPATLASDSEDQASTKEDLHPGHKVPNRSTNVRRTASLAGLLLDDRVYDVVDEFVGLVSDT